MIILDKIKLDIIQGVPQTGVLSSIKEMSVVAIHRPELPSHNLELREKTSSKYDCGAIKSLKLLSEYAIWRYSAQPEFLQSWGDRPG